VWCWQQLRRLNTPLNLTLVLLLCCQLENSFRWNSAFENAWPDSRSIAEAISVDENTEILSENAYLFRNALHGTVPIKQLHDTTFADLDNDAVNEGQFSHVYLDGMTNPAVSRELIDGPLSRRYVLVSFAPVSRLSGLDHSGSGLYSALFKRIDL